MAAATDCQKFSDIMRQIFKNVARDIDLHSKDMSGWCNESRTIGWRSLEAKVPSDRYTMFFEQLNSPEVGRSGDVLVGFFSHEDVSITVGIGPDIRCTTQVGAHSFKYALDEAFVIPLVCLRFHVITVTSTGKLPWCLYLCLDSVARRGVCYGSFFRRTQSHTLCEFSNGIAEEIPEDGDYESKNTYLQLPDMRAIHLTFQLDPEVVDRLVTMTARFSQCGLSLVEVPDVMSLLRSATGRLVVGSRATVGNSNLGIHMHRDESYQGGDSSMLIYLTDVEEGGETVFSNETFKPKKGLVVIFDISTPHHSNQVTKGNKLIVSCEILKSRTLYALVEGLRRRHAIKRMKRCIAELKYVPGGVGYLSAMEDFESLRSPVSESSVVVTRLV